MDGLDSRWGKEELFWHLYPAFTYSGVYGVCGAQTDTKVLGVLLLGQQ